MTELERAYLAGLFDGEGCISYFNQTGTPLLKIVLQMCSQEVVAWIQDIFPGSFREILREGHPICYRWEISKKEALKSFLEMIQPYARVKRKLVSLGLQFTDTIGDSRRPISDENLYIRYRIIDEIDKTNFQRGRN